MFINTWLLLHSNSFSGYVVFRSSASTVTCFRKSSYSSAASRLFRHLQLSQKRLDVMAFLKIDFFTSNLIFFWLKSGNNLTSSCNSSIGGGHPTHAWLSICFREGCLKGYVIITSIMFRMRFHFFWTMLNILSYIIYMHWKLQQYITYCCNNLYIVI